jgi:twitching motility protein PilT
MSEAFSWNKVLGTDEKPPNPADLEGLTVDPRNGEPMVPLQVVETHPETDHKYAQHLPGAVPMEALIPVVNENKYEIHADRPEDTIAEDARELADVHIDEILRMAIERKASDIHLTVGLPPMVRQDGEVQPLPFVQMQPQDTRRMIYDTLTNEQLTKFEETHELDFAYSVKNLARFRFNVYMQRGSVAAALRAIPTKIPSFETLGLPLVIREMAKRSSGLILVTGPTGSGKSTTIATMIDDINENRTSHILTIEDPIEYLHVHKKCMVNQREMHSDTFSFHSSLRAVLREDPDIILVGELRDLETIEAALTLAETGHLVFGTLHTRNAPSTVDRIIDVFPSDQQDQIRVLLGNTLEGVVSQQLLPKLGGGRCASIEIMIGTPAIKNLIREGKTHQMYSVIETNVQIGMQTMDKALADLFRNGYANYEECLMRAVDKETFARLAKGG